jgi:hypothetical protein
MNSERILETLIAVCTDNIVNIPCPKVLAPGDNFSCRIFQIVANKTGLPDLVFHLHHAHPLASLYLAGSILRGHFRRAHR